MALVPFIGGFLIVWLVMAIRRGSVIAIILVSLLIMTVITAGMLLALVMIAPSYNY
jgi:hypothetical protein